MAASPPERPCGETPRGSHGSHRYMLDGALYQCAGGEVREQTGEPAPPQTVAEQVHDLERILERVREAVGTDMVLVSCEQHEARIAALETTLRAVLSRFVHETHPGRRCKQTDHVNVETIAGWHAVLDGDEE